MLLPASLDFLSLLCDDEPLSLALRERSVEDDTEELFESERLERSRVSPLRLETELLLEERLAEERCEEDDDDEAFFEGEPDFRSRVSVLERLEP